jgi:hypothetical protein
MRKRPLTSGLLFAVAVLAVGCCALASGTKTYSPLGPVTRIEVHTDGQPVKVIDDPVRVARIVEYADARRQRWGGTSDAFGVPVPRVSAFFYEGDKFRGHFGVGPGFLETQRDGDFASRVASEREEREFLELLDVGNYDLRKP